MKKLYSLIRASMSSDMNIFKIKQKKDSKSSKILMPLFISLCFMFAIWTYANMLFEKMAPLHLQFIVIALSAFVTAIMVIVEGIYKAGPLIFNCKDDQLLLSLPIKRRTVLFIRIFKFYVFEVMFNALFIIPLMIAYIRWAEPLEWTFFLTSVVMIFFLPIIPVIISCIIGAITSGLSSRFKYKNAAQIIISMLFLVGVLYISMNLENMMEYITKNATSINEVITKIYYPAGVYSELTTNFNVVTLLIFMGINILLFTIGIMVLSKFYFKINSRLKKVTIHKSKKVKEITYNSRSVTSSLVKKELNVFFKTPVFIINAGFGIVLFLIAVIALCVKGESMFKVLENYQELFDNISLVIFALIGMASFTTSITSSMISLEGKNINILKSLPVPTKKILISKVIASSVLTIPAIIIGTIILFIKFNIPIIDMILLLILSIVTPLISHLLGLIINLKYPKLDFDNAAEVVKQSSSTFVSTTLGFLLLMFTVVLLLNVVGTINSSLLLLILTLVYVLVDIILYLMLIKSGTKSFNSLSV